MGLTETLGQQVIVENRPGGSTIIGMQFVPKSPSDGYTFVFASVTSLATNVSGFKNLPYDPVRDFAPVALCFTTPLYLVVHRSLPVRSVKQLIAGEIAAGQAEVRLRRPCHDQSSGGRAVQVARRRGHAARTVQERGGVFRDSIVYRRLS